MFAHRGMTVQLYRAVYPSARLYVPMANGRPVSRTESCTSACLVVCMTVCLPVGLSVCLPKGLAVRMYGHRPDRVHMRPHVGRTTDGPICR